MLEAAFHAGRGITSEEAIGDHKLGCKRRQARFLLRPAATVSRIVEEMLLHRG